jgi:hypothetical protein
MHVGATGHASAVRPAPVRLVHLRTRPTLVTLIFFLWEVVLARVLGLRPVQGLVRVLEIVLVLVLALVLVCVRAR